MCTGYKAETLWITSRSTYACKYATMCSFTSVVATRSEDRGGHKRAHAW